MKRIGALFLSVLLLACFLWPGGGYYSGNPRTLESRDGDGSFTPRLALDNRILDGIDRQAVCEISARQGIRATFDDRFCAFEPKDTGQGSAAPGQRILLVLMEILMDGREFPGAITFCADMTEVSIYCPDGGALPGDIAKTVDALKLAGTAARAFGDNLRRDEPTGVTIYRKPPVGGFYGWHLEPSPS